MDKHMVWDTVLHKHNFQYVFYVCLVFVMLSRLFIAALWSPAGKGLTSGLSLSLSHVVSWARCDT